MAASPPFGMLKVELFIRRNFDGKMRTLIKVRAQYIWEELLPADPGPRTRRSIKIREKGKFRDIIPHSAGHWSMFFDHSKQRNDLFRRF